MKDKKTMQLNLRWSENDQIILESIHNKMPNKNDSEIIRTALKMLAIELGCEI